MPDIAILCSVNHQPYDTTRHSLPSTHYRPTATGDGRRAAPNDTGDGSVQSSSQDRRAVDHRVGKRPG